MSQFRVFEVDKKAKFLGKAKENKAKREEQNKRQRAVILLQKNVRAFLCSARKGGRQYPLLIKRVEQVQKNSTYIQQAWDTIRIQPQILKRRLMEITITALQRAIVLDIRVQSLLRLLCQFAQRGTLQLSSHNFLFIIENYFSQISQTSTIFKLYQNDNFKKALQIFISEDVHRLVWIIEQLSDFVLINETIRLYPTRTVQNQEKYFIQQGQSLEQIQMNFERVVQLMQKMVDKNQNTNEILFVLSLLMQKLKSKYIETIIQKYKIDAKILFSESLKGESEEFLKEKNEWRRYEAALSPLANLLGYFLSKFYKNGASEIESSLKIVIQISKLNQSFATLKLTNQQFFLLIDRLDVKLLLNMEEQQLKLSELYFMLMILRSYLESINDIQFIELFRFETEQLKGAIKSSIIPFMKKLCTLCDSNSQILKEVTLSALNFVSNLYNKIFRTRILQTSVFEDSSLTVFASNYKWTNYGNSSYFKELKRIVEISPFLMPIQTRFLMFKNMISEDRNNGGYYSNEEVRIRRGHEFQDAFSAFYGNNIKKTRKIVFINQFGFNEAGYDAGGLTKELLTRVFKVAFDPKFGLFVENSQKQLMPNPDFKYIQSNQQKAKQFQFLGQLLGKSLYENIILGIKFAGPFLNLLVNRRNSFDDLLSIDPQLYRSLAYIATMQSGVEQLQLTFQYHDNLSGELVNLVPNAANYKVNNRNKMQYINLLINYKVNNSFERQTRFVRKGLRTVISQKWIEMFNYAELNYLISGTGKIDVQDWKSHTAFLGNKLDQDFVNAFWKVVSEFSEQQKSLLLKFVTSCERPSFLGFKDLKPPFTVHVIEKQDSLPVAHTCSNVLDLPKYASIQILRQKLLYAIKSGAGFEFA